MTTPLAANVKTMSPLEKMTHVADALGRQLRERTEERDALRKDAARLDALEAFVNANEALVIHTGNWSDKYHAGMMGLGLRPGALVQTLREALDQLVRS